MSKRSASCQNGMELGAKRACELVETGLISPLVLDVEPVPPSLSRSILYSYRRFMLRENKLTAMPQTGPFLGIPIRVNYGHPIPHTKTAPIFL